MPKKVLITGGSGMIGKRLTQLLMEEGFSVSHLGRSNGRGTVPSFLWDVEKNQMDAEALEGVDAIIHLAGASVGEKRWTSARKRLILESRMKSTALLYDALKKNRHQVRSLISASAIGYYGFDSDGIYTEESPPGKDFLAQVARQWEEEADKLSDLGIRVVKLRIGIVLSKAGGALMEMVKPIRWWAGAPLGKGNQYLTWIHLDDLCRMFIKSLRDESMKGAYNAVGPEWVTNRELTEAIAVMLNKPLLLPSVPSFVLRVILGQMAEIVVTGSKVSAEKIQKKGFEFRYKKLEEALTDLLR